jgi:hypothetical protein
MTLGEIMFFIYALLIFVSSSHAQENFTYKDSSGHPYRRWIITEQENDRNMLLLVVDEDLARQKNALPQEVIYRKIFEPQEFAKMFERLDFHKNFAEQTIHTELKTGKEPEPLWIATKSWDAATEADYGHWVETEVGDDYLQGTGVEIDCADLAVLLRWVYARNHKLPVANSLAATGLLFGQFSGNANWDLLPTDADWKKDQRFIAALKYILDNTYTHSIAKDLYPIEITRDYVTPGSVDLFLRNAASGHTEVIKSIGEGSFLALMGNEPSAENIYTTDAQIHNMPSAGFVRWRWPELVSGQWVLRSSDKMPGYSLMQYQNADMDDVTYESWIEDQLNLFTNPSDKAYAKLNSLIHSLMRRKFSVVAGAISCSYQKCPAQWENDLSTPALDKSIQSTLDIFLSIYNSLEDYEKTDILYLANAKEKMFPSHDDSSPTYEEFILNGNIAKMNSDAKKTIPERWGLEKNASSSLFEEALGLAQEIRDQGINTAQALCFAEGKKCDPKDPAVKNLSTRTWDFGIHKVKIDLDGYSIDAQDFKSVFSKTYENLPYCSWNYQSQCTSWDLIFGQPAWFQNISSDPLDPLLKRYGIPQ